MRTPDLRKSIAGWVRLGVFFGGAPARATPDLERLLLDSARLAPTSPRLFYQAISWLSIYGNFVARHRLKHLIEDGYPLECQPALGALLALATKHGASRELLIAAEACRKAPSARPFFDLHRSDPSLARIARTHASPTGRRWNLWVPDQQPKRDALRPPRWILERNPDLLDRIVRKGDLRCSILLVLQNDTADHSAESEVALARLCSASRLAVRNALDDLEREGRILRTSTTRVRGTRITLMDPERKCSGPVLRSPEPWRKT